MSNKRIVFSNIKPMSHYQKVLLTGVLSIAMTGCEISIARQNIQQPSLEVKTVADASTEDQQKQAVQVIRHYYNAINRRDYKSAYEDWSGDGAASQATFEQFKQGFRNTLSSQVKIGKPGRLDGAAGSLYIEIPVSITAKSVNGTIKHFKGSYVLRRVNDVPGSTPKQRMWHIYSAKIVRVN
ncbi:hypothetical protein I8748_25385 [Nostoc sp. CENA67]|uniref:Lipoprotein n=1 Tax=Amazonocrinis nigriterrae CENA67 TaxID=2794033 RepID=A0A8J7HT29_9NOST|nr:hypothetical protein [Amazonocrinis nigriterrae]MBH8565468.1 hypothetical protein [Amazonocrinis nigriterrae CENA67]